MPGRKVALAIGFLALAIGVLIVDARGASGYELSIYGGTPVLFWVAVAFAIAVSLGVSLSVRPGPTRTVALVLGGLAVAAVAGLPVLRGYYFHGTADALTHLGWARDIATGVMVPNELFYPGIHTCAVLLSSVAGIALERALLYVVATMTIVGFVFVPLAVRAVASDDRAVVIAAFSTFLLFMVHNLGVFLHAHSYSQALFFTALVLFLAFAFLTRGSWIKVGVLLAVASIALLLYHPQVAANVILVFGAISVLQFVFRRYRSHHPIAGHRGLYAHTGLLLIAFVVWVNQFEGWAFENLARVQGALTAYVAGRPPTAGGNFQSQATSLTAIGSGLPEIFVKLFLVATVFSLLAGALMAASILGRADDSRPTANAISTYLAVGSVAILPLAVAYFAGNIAEHYFRHFGFMLLIVTIVGSLALTRGMSTLSSRYSPRIGTAAIALLLAVMIPLSLATVYPSPFIYKQSQQVTEPRMDGYQTVFEINDESVPLGGVRGAPWRYSDAVQGVSESTRYSTSVSNENLTRLQGYYDGGGYLAVADIDRQREVQAYQQLRYTERAFSSLDAQPGVNQVASNGAVTLYQVPEGGG